jgi:UDP-glucose 4-epimerase
MRILITGGTGFIGGRLCSHIVESGHKVFVSVRRPEARQWDWPEGVSLVDLDWESKDSIGALDMKLDAIIHAAGVNAKNSLLNPGIALQFNGLGTLRLLMSAIANRVPNFLYISTTQVYGATPFGELSELSPTTNLHPYATSHLAGENAILFARSQGQINGAVVRLANAYGPPIHKDVNCWNLVINDLCRQAIVNHELKLNSSGEQYRNFVSITATCQVIERLVTGKSNSSESALYNLAATETIQVIEVARRIQSRCKRVQGFEPIIIVGGANEDQAKYWLNIDRLKSSGCVLPNFDLEEIDRTLAFCDANFSHR